MESKSSPSDLQFFFAIDRGGTFTDIYCDIVNPHTNEKQSKIMKLLSVDKKNYQDAPTEGIRRILEEYTQQRIPRNVKIPTNQIKSIRMGTTVATNALLERKGERLALLITKGLRDVIAIGT